MYEDLTLHTQIVGSKSIQEYFRRALAKVPAAAGSSLIRTLGSDKGGGYEWFAAPAYRATVKRGITALTLERAKIPRLSVIWDASLLGEADVQSMAVLGVW